MKIARVSELKAELSRYLARVKQGEEVLVTEHGRAVARLVPVAGADLPGHMEGLERAGLVRRGAGKLPSDFWRRRRPRDPGGRVLAALLEEREQGR